MVIIKGRTTPAARFILKGIKICEMLNKHLREKIEKQKKKQLEEIYEIEMVSQSSDDEIDEYKNLIS